ncbi:MAG TPA: ABC transporter permease [Jatrophihabitans sp.]|nr:ABC transporter permease [Jatrophihabitans sp.]
MTVETTADPPVQPAAEPEATGIGRRSGVIRLVAAHEIQVKLRDRNFLISTGVLVLLLVASFGVQFYLTKRSSTTTIAISSSAGQSAVRQARAEAHAAGISIDLKPAQYATDSDAVHAVRQKKAAAALVRRNDAWTLVGLSSKNDTITTWLVPSLQRQSVADNAAAAGVDLGRLSRNTTPSYTLLDPNAGRNEAASRISATVFGLLFYLAVLVFGAAIAQSVVEEKQNRVVEILASAIPVRHLLIGKILGSTVLAMAQLVLVVALGLLGLSITGHAGQLALVSGAGWFVIFFLIGFAALACMWAVVGSLATRSEDIQSTSPPMTVLVLSVFLIGILATGTTLKVASYIPLLSTIAMPTRLVSGDASWPQALISALIAVLAAAGIVRLAERMYRNSLMQTHRRMHIRDALRHQEA